MRIYCLAPQTKHHVLTCPSVKTISVCTHVFSLSVCLFMNGTTDLVNFIQFFYGGDFLRSFIRIFLFYKLSFANIATSGRNQLV